MHDVSTLYLLLMSVEASDQAGYYTIIIILCMKQ